jgi:S-adenosylmethionine:tRNA ribosyltransferase-isomerase
MRPTVTRKSAIARGRAARSTFTDALPVAAPALEPARGRRDARQGDRLLVLDAQSARLRDGHIGDLPVLLRPSDLLVVNDSATLPASLQAGDIEVRLAAVWPDGAFDAVLFGAGDWHTPTEHRPAPPAFTRGHTLRVAPGLHATIIELSPISPRLVRLRFSLSGAALWSALYALGHAVQYSYLTHELAPWDIHNAYASRPWSVEPPSAGRPLTWSVLEALRRGGVSLASITHGAGLSSTGDPAIDAALPLPEPFEVSARTVAAVDSARAAGGRVIAVGTTVVRALESAARGGSLAPATGRTDLHIDAAFRPRVVDGLLTGIHAPGTSHFTLLHAFASTPLLEHAADHAARQGYLTHELGDSLLVLS